MEKANKVMGVSVFVDINLSKLSGLDFEGSDFPDIENIDDHWRDSHLSSFTFHIIKGTQCHLYIAPPSMSVDLDFEGFTVELDSSYFQSNTPEINVINHNFQVLDICFDDFPLLQINWADIGEVMKGLPGHDFKNLSDKRIQRSSVLMRYQGGSINIPYELKIMAHSVVMRNALCNITLSPITRKLTDCL